LATLKFLDQSLVLPVTAAEKVWIVRQRRLVLFSLIYGG
jgi:hypothetical protein